MSEIKCESKTGNRSIGSGPLCYLVTDWLQEPAGTEALVVMVAGALTRRGWRVRIFTHGYNARTCLWTPLLQEASVKVTSFRLPLFRGKHLQQRILAKYLWREAAREKPMFIFAPTNDPLVIHSILSKPADAMPIFVHDPSEAGPKCPSYHPLWFDACRQISGLSVHGRVQLDASVRFYKTNVPVAVVWPASFPPNRVSLRAGCHPVVRFGQLGRLHSLKGGAFLVGAFTQLLNEGYRAELHFFGDGEDRQRLETLVKSLGVSEAVHFHGRYSWRDLDDIADQIDVAIMASIYEGFGLVMLEMMSRGRPVISSDVGSSREILQDLGGGWVVQRADTDSLWRAMAECCKNPDMVETEGRRAVEIWKRHFTPDAMIERYLKFWESVTK